MNFKPTPSRRNVFLDIETVSLDANEPAGALSALTGRIVCICLLIDDGHEISEISLCAPDEASLLRAFWSAVRVSDTFVGHNALSFDLPFIRQRSWIVNVKPSRRVDLRRFYTKDVFDTMQTFSVWGATKHPGLGALGEAFGCGGKIAEGTSVQQWWEKGDLGSISSYCTQDVRLTYQVYCRLLFREVPERFLRLSSAIALTKPSSSVSAVDEAGHSYDQRLGEHKIAEIPMPALEESR